MSSSSGRFRLPVPIMLAARYLRSTRRDAFVSFLSATAAVGIGLGVAALILSLGALSGFQRALKGEILGRTPHLSIELDVPGDEEAVAGTIRQFPGVMGVSRVLYGRGWMGTGGRVRPVSVVGFEGALPPSFPNAIGDGSGVWVGERLTMRLGLERGEVVELASSRSTLTPLGPQPRIRRLPVAGLFKVGRTEQEDRIAIPLRDAILLFGSGSLRLEVATGSLSEALDLADRLPAILPAGAKITTWEEANRPLFFALKLEKGVMFTAVFLIVVVASLALISGLSLVISNKRAEIGMLGAMGLSQRAIRSAFQWLGGLLAVIGIAAGSLIGLTSAWVLDRYRLLPLPDQVYFLDHVPFHVRPGDLTAVILLTLTLAVLCSTYAAVRASSVPPMESLRR